MMRPVLGDGAVRRSDFAIEQARAEAAAAQRKPTRTEPASTLHRLKKAPG